MTLLEEVKLRIRVKNSKFDEGEIQPLIDACKQDMKRVGITKTETDPLVKQAIRFYCKANFGFSEDSERYQAAYDALRDSMALSGDYGGETDAVP